MGTLLLLNVRPFYVHCQRHRPEEWPELVAEALRACCTGQGEWAADLSTKPDSSASSDARVGGRPVPICLRHVDSTTLQVCENPALANVVTWGPNQSGEHLYAGIVVKRLVSFGGDWGKAPQNLDVALDQPVFANPDETLVFVNILLRLGQGICKGLGRRYPAFLAKVMGLVRKWSRSSIPQPMADAGTEGSSPLKSTHPDAAPSGVGAREYFFLLQRGSLH